MKKNTDGHSFRRLLSSVMKKRLVISAIVLLTFLGLIVGIGFAISSNTTMSEQWKELLLLMLGAFIGSYGKIIDYWFSDTDKDKMLVQKMDEEDGISLSNTAGGDAPTSSSTPIISEAFTNAIANSTTEKSEGKKGVEIDEDGDGTMDGLDFDGDGTIDEYFEHRQCDHVWGDSDGDGDEECLKCGKIKDTID
jgi:hypothetical protein